MEEPSQGEESNRREHEYVKGSEDEMHASKGGRVFMRTMERACACVHACVCVCTCECLCACTSASVQMKMCVHLERE